MVHPSDGLTTVTLASRCDDGAVRLIAMDINAIIELVNSYLTRADWAAYENWDVVSPILNTIIPPEAANYTPGA